MSSSTTTRRHRPARRIRPHPGPSPIRISPSARCSIARQPELEANSWETRSWRRLSVARSVKPTSSGLYPDAQPHLEAPKAPQAGVGVRKTPPLSRRLIHLGLLFLARGQVDLAKAMVTEAYDAYKARKGSESPDTLDAAHSLGDVYFALGRPQEAEKLFSESLTGFRKALGRASPKTINAAGSLGVLYQSQGRLAEAEPLLRETRDGLTRLAWSRPSRHSDREE